MYGSHTFLGHLMPQPDMSLITTVYRKLTHTNLYLQWDSHHNPDTAKTPQLLKEGRRPPQRTLRRFKYPGWALNQANIKSNRPNQEQYHQQHQQTPHSGAIHQRFKWKWQKHLKQTRHTNAFQERQHHQAPAC